MDIHLDRVPQHVMESEGLNVEETKVTVMSQINSGCALVLAIYKLNKSSSVPAFS